MKPRIKKILYAFVAILIITLTVTAGIFTRILYLESRLHPVTMPFSEMKKIPMCVDRIFPLSDTEKCFGYADYVFIGTVEEILGTEYDEIYMHSFRLYEEIPETHFRVKCIKNIKGTVPEEFTLKTSGGQQPNGTLEEMHPMSEDKSTYLFMCIENRGEVHYFNCIYIGDYDWYTSSQKVDETFKRYKEVYKNQDLSVRKYR